MAPRVELIEDTADVHAFAVTKVGYGDLASPSEEILDWIAEHYDIARDDRKSLLAKVEEIRREYLYFESSES